MTTTTLSAGQRVTIGGYARNYAATYLGESRFIAYDGSALLIVQLDDEGSPSVVHASQVSA